MENADKMIIKFNWCCTVGRGMRKANYFEICLEMNVLTLEDTNGDVVEGAVEGDNDAVGGHIEEGHLSLLEDEVVQEEVEPEKPQLTPQGKCRHFGVRSMISVHF